MTSGPRDGQQKRGQAVRPSSETTPCDAGQSTDTKRLRTEYPVTLQRGQRKYGPPAQWDDDPPRGTEIFVSKIPKDMLEDEIVPIFQQVGPIYELRLMMETSTFNKGFAFVKYCKKDDAEIALSNLNGFEIRPDIPLSVTRSIDNNRIFIGNIPKNFSSDDLFNHMSKMTAGVAKVILYPSVNDRAKNRGYGFVQYESHQHAATARQKLMANPTLWSGHEVKVDWAEPEIAVDEEVMKKVVVLPNMLSPSFDIGSPLMLQPVLTELKPNLSQSLEDLQKRTGCSIKINKGHKNYGPPKTWSGLPPPKGSEVFVSKLPRDMFEDELVPMLEKVGTVYEMRLMIDAFGWSRGYSYVRYTSVDEADKAISMLNDYEIKSNNFISVAKSVDNNRLFVGGIPKIKQQDDLYDEMKHLTDGVSGVILYPDVNDKAKNRGFAFVEYETHLTASIARQKLMKSPPVLWGTNQVKVDWAEPEIEVDKETMDKVKVLYVRNLAMNTSEQQLLELFSGCGGHIERVRKLHDYAFIHFATREQAEAAKNKYNGISVDGCEIDINWSKPVTNKEEYQQRKAMSKAMYRGPTAPLATGLNVHGEPFLINQRLRNAAGSQGFGPKHILNKLKQCETPLTAVHPAVMNPSNLIACNLAIKSPLEVGMASAVPYGLEKLSPDETMGQTVQDLVAQQAIQSPWIHPYMMPPQVAPGWNNQNPYAAQLHPGQNFVPTPYLVQPTYQVYDTPYNPYTCPPFYTAPVLTSVPGLNGNAVNVCSDAFSPR